MTIKAINSGVGLTAVGIAALLCLLTGCASNPVHSTAPVIKASTVPVVYDQRLSPKPLGSDQVQLALKKAAPLVPAHQQVWFILVHWNRINEGNPDWNATVYLKPEASTPRLRKGKCIHVRSDYSYSVKKFVKPQFAWKEFRPDLRNYVQVSLPEQPFGLNLEVPKPRLWPFLQPVGFSDSEIIEMVDFARTSPRVERPDGHRGPQFDGQQPIYFIYRLPGGTVEVMSGSMQDICAGAGDGLECVKKNGKWVAIEASWWNS